MYSLEKLEQFASLLHAAQETKRIARRPGADEMNTTAEHTFELVMMCWYVVSVNKLNLDIERILKYALAHDIVEAYAGDTYIYDEEARKTKTVREQKALERIRQELPEFGELTDIIAQYEKRQDPEAKFVYALDKLVDPLDFSMEKRPEAIMWKEQGVSYEQHKSYKDHKIAESEHVVPYWELLTEKLQGRKDFYFDA